MPAPDRRAAQAGLLAGLLVLAGAAPAAELVDLHVARDDDGYIVNGALVVDRATPPAFEAATDFPAMADAARLIDSSQRIGDDRVASTLSLCVLFYCKTVKQVAVVTTRAYHTLDMAFVPGAGDFRSGHVHWQFTPKGPDRTVIVFKAALVPDFWVPPMIGPWAIRHALADQIRDTGQAIEQVAAAHQSASAGTGS